MFYSWQLQAEVEIDFQMLTYSSKTRTNTTPKQINGSTQSTIETANIADCRTLQTIDHSHTT